MKNGICGKSCRSKSLLKGIIGVSLEYNHGMNYALKPYQLPWRRFDPAMSQDEFRNPGLAAHEIDQSQGIMGQYYQEKNNWDINDPKVITFQFILEFICGNRRLKIFNDCYDLIINNCLRMSMQNQPA